MKKKFINLSAIFVAAISLSLASCSDSSTPEQDLMSASANEAESLASPYSNEITLREIMSSLIDPHADALWNAVRVVADSNGITEYAPESEEDWNALRISAVSIIEGANALMVPGRRVARPGAVGEFPEFEFTPEEVEEKLAADRQSWVQFSRGLQNAAFELLDAVDSRNADLLSEYGALLDEACEACHSVYWYRAGI
ncbi:hypothetical protein N8600_04750 [Gammaproteobacteria bacterium]|nr:hypothetical protein [Gammaproteobacteria bacterium]